MHEFDHGYRFAIVKNTTEKVLYKKHCRKNRRTTSQSKKSQNRPNKYNHEQDSEKSL